MMPMDKDLIGAGLEAMVESLLDKCRQNLTHLKSARTLASINQLLRDVERIRLLQERLERDHYGNDDEVPF